jgi:molybdopterin-guanine dinucleotide biosynthesis protein A
MSKNFSCAGVILAGGLNSRMAGQNKARLPIEGQTILDRLVALFRAFFDPIIIVTNQPRDYLDEGVILVTDLVDIRSSLTGLYSGLFYSPRPHAFITGCDMPFLKQGLLELMLKNLEPRWDVVVPVTEEGYQPLSAIYSRRCLEPIANQLAEGQLKVSHFFSKVRIKKVPEIRLRQVDPELKSFFNINTPEDMDGLNP